jgi:hypothetical protein
VPKTAREHFTCSRLGGCSGHAVGMGNNRSDKPAARSASYELITRSAEYTELGVLVELGHFDKHLRGIQLVSLSD